MNLKIDSFLDHPEERKLLSTCFVSRFLSLIPSFMHFNCFKQTGIEYVKDIKRSLRINIFDELNKEYHAILGEHNIVLFNVFKKIE